MATPEHRFQQYVTGLASKVIAGPHRFRSFDRAASRGHGHAAEARRGQRRGTPDTETTCPGPVPFTVIAANIELKKPFCQHLKAYQPSASQEIEMQNLRNAGAYAACAWSCADMVRHWRAAGIPLVAGADIMAAQSDARLRAEMDAYVPRGSKAVDPNVMVMRKPKRAGAKPTRKHLAFDAAYHGVGR